MSLRQTLDRWFLPKEEFCKKHGHDYPKMYDRFVTGISPIKLKKIDRYIYKCRHCGKTKFEDKEQGDYDLKHGLDIYGSSGICSACVKFNICPHSDGCGIHGWVRPACPINSFDPGCSKKEFKKEMRKKKYGNTLVTNYW